MRRSRSWLLLAALTALGCDDAKPAAATGTAPTGASATAASANGAAPASASAAPTASSTKQVRPSGPQYPRKGIKPLASGCAEPAVLLPGKGKQSSGDISDGTSDLGAIVSQLLWANPQFLPVSREPGAAGEIQVLAVSGWQYVDDTSDGWKNLLGGSVLAVRCADAETCNDLAALYLTVRQWPKPQLHCGKLPQFAENTHAVNFTNAEGAERAPGDKHIVGLCARVAACRYRRDPTLAVKVYSICTKSPVRGKASCGTKLSCDEVLACADR